MSVSDGNADDIQVMEAQIFILERELQKRQEYSDSMIKIFENKKAELNHEIQKRRAII